MATSVSAARADSSRWQRYSGRTTLLWLLCHTSQVTTTGTFRAVTPAGDGCCLSVQAPAEDGEDGSLSVQRLLQLVSASQDRLEAQHAAAACLRACDGGGLCSCPELRAVNAHSRGALGVQGKGRDHPEDPLARWRALLPSLQAKFREDGYVVVAGLVSAQALSAAEGAMWDAMERDGALESINRSISRHDAATWPHQWSGSMAHPQIAALWTPAYRAMAKALAGSDNLVMENWSPGGALEGHRSGALTHGLAVNIFPREEPEEGWRWPTPHIDGTFGLPVRLATMTYLTDSQKSGGNTVVWPRSAALLRELAASEPERFASMTRAVSLAKAKSQLEAAGIGKLAPVEVEVTAGSVLFYDILTAHAGSLNLADRPRLAVNMKWGL